MTLDAVGAAKLDRLAERAAIERDELASALLRAALTTRIPIRNGQPNSSTGFPGRWSGRSWGHSVPARATSSRWTTSLVARVDIADVATADLDELIATHHLPP